MRYVYHRSWLVNVYRPDRGRLVVESHYMDTETEMTGIMVVGAGDYRVLEARLETCRAQEAGSVGVIEVHGLRGLIAYPTAIRTFRQGLPGGDYGRRGDLFLEGLKGLLQAELFVWKERGFASMEDYDAWFEREYANSCVYYTHLDEVTQAFTAYVAGQDRERCLFKRHRNCSLSRLDDDELLLQAVISDSFHEVGIALRLEDTGHIKEATASIVRVPDPICQRASQRVVHLVGLPLEPEARKELITASGGPEGCAHIVDLVQEGAKALALAKSSWIR